MTNICRCGTYQQKVREGDPRRSQGLRTEDRSMTIHTPLGRASLRRRKFLVSAAAVAGGFSLGLRISCRDGAAHRRRQEINAWVVIHPDDKVVIRIARSEMGQGTLTGLLPANRRGARVRLEEGHPGNIRLRART